MYTEHNIKGTVDFLVLIYTYIYKVHIVAMNRVNNNKKSTMIKLYLQIDKGCDITCIFILVIYIYIYIYIYICIYMVFEPTTPCLPCTRS